jgi:hypothetical protein
MKFLKKSIIATALATLLATQTSAIITPYGELTSTTTIYANGEALTTTTWKPINEDYLLKISQKRQEKTVRFHNEPWNHYSTDTNLLPPTNDQEPYVWRHKYWWLPQDHLHYTILIQTSNNSFTGKFSVCYYIGDKPIFRQVPEVTYNRATRQLHVISTLTNMANDNVSYRDWLKECTTVFDVYYPIVTTENGDVIPNADVEITRNKEDLTVTAIYKNVDIDPTVQYYITPAAKNDHIQCAPAQPVTINFTNSAG